MKFNHIKRIIESPFYVNCKKHYCDDCGEQMSKIKVSKAVNSNSAEAKDFDLSLADNSMVGDVKFVLTEFQCPKCKKQISVNEMKQIEKHKMSKNKIIDCSYKLGGGMNGGIYYVSLRVTEDKTEAKLSVTEKETWQSPVKEQEYTVPASAFEEVEAVVEKYCLYELNIDKLTKYELLDADVETIDVEFENGKRIHLSCVELPEKLQGIYKDLHDCMLSFADK